MELRIGIPIPTRTDPEYNRRSWPMYAAAVAEAGGVPVEIALDLPDSHLAELARSCDGVVLPGSPADVDPTRYGQIVSSTCAAADPHRERTDRLLLEESYRMGKPVLGICFGLQSLNVWLGGTLLQHLQPAPVNHAAGASVVVAHSVQVMGRSMLAGVLAADAIGDGDGQYRLPVNSSHHQAVDQVGQGLRICALSAQDGVVEAVEGHGLTGSPAFVLGLQWHPERSIEISATSRSLFRALINAAIVCKRSPTFPRGV